MSSPDLQTVIIACPSCGTRYQVPYATIGAAGREVQCAQCSSPWHATADAPLPGAADDDLLFTPAEESALDAAFEAEAEASAALPPPPSPGDADAAARRLAELRATLAPKPGPAAVDAAQLNRRRRAFARRQRLLMRHLPIARVRRTARFAALVLLLALFATGFGLRAELVRAVPQLAGLYAAIGLPVNVVGLTFEDARTLTSFRDGKPLMLITSRIRSVAPRPVAVPPVLVSLVDRAGAIVYEWTVTPRIAEMEPGEVMEFSTEVSAPPDGAVTVRLSFTTPRGGSAAPLAGTL